MSTIRFSLPSAVFLILRKDSSILLMRRANTGWKDGTYDLPAGHIDGGEGSAMAAAREAKEELAIVVQASDLTLVVVTHSLYEDKKEYYNVFFEAKNWQGEPRINEPEKCDDLRWFNLNDLPQELTPSTEFGLQTLLSGKNYAEKGFDN